MRPSIMEAGTVWNRKKNLRSAGQSKYPESLRVIRELQHGTTCWISWVYCGKCNTHCILWRLQAYTFSLQSQLLRIGSLFEKDVPCAYLFKDRDREDCTLYKLCNTKQKTWTPCGAHARCVVKRASLLEQLNPQRVWGEVGRKLAGMAHTTGYNYPRRW